MSNGLKKLPKLQDYMYQAHDGTHVFKGEDAWKWLVEFAEAAQSLVYIAGMIKKLDDETKEANS